MTDKRKKFLIFTLLSLTIVFCLFLLLNRFQSSSDQDKNNAKNSPNTEGNLVYSPEQDNQTNEEDTNSENEEAYQEALDYDTDKDEGHAHPEPETMFNTNETPLVPFSIQKPVTLENVELPSSNSDIFYANAGFVFLFAENQEIQFYDPTRSKYLALESNVKDATYSNNGKDIIFQMKNGPTYQLYRFNYIDNNKGFEPLANSVTPYIQYGLLNNTLFYTREDIDNVVNYFPLEINNHNDNPSHFETAPYDFMDVKNDFILGYTFENTTIEANNKKGESLFKHTIPNKFFHHIVDLKLHHISDTTLSYVGIFSSDEHLMNRMFIYNGEIIEELVETVEAYWIDETYIVAREDSYSSSLFIYNLKTGDRIDLDGSVRSMFFDDTERVIYYTKFETPFIFKIELH